MGGQYIFWGGSSNTGVTSRVDIYDTVSKTWTNTTLSSDKYMFTGTTANGKIFFGGGVSFTLPKYRNSLDIYNANTYTRTTTYFPFIGGRNLTALSIGDNIIFAGGDVGNALSAQSWIHIYNAYTNQWSPSLTLSQPKTELTSLIYKNKAYFIGGITYDAATNKSFPSETIDVYDNASESWSVMPIPRMITSAVGVKRAYIRSAVAGCKMFLLPDVAIESLSADTIAIYDFARNTWSYETLPHPHIKSIIAASGNKVYFAGGSEPSNTNFSADIDILTLEPKLQLAIANTAVTTYDFGTVETGDLSTINVALSNEGDYDLLFKDLTQRISISGDVDDFTLDPAALQTTDTLEPAEIITLPVSFHSTTTGTKQITISIQSNDPNAPVYTLTVTGTATDISTSVLKPSEQNITVYPNPTTGILYIDTQQQGTLNVQVLNVQGQTVKKQSLTDDDADLDISALPDGFYVVKITGERSSAVVKVLKR
jgi:hypothetical protein